MQNQIPKDKRALVLPIEMFRLSRPVLVGTTQFSAARAIQRVIDRKKKRPKYGR